MDEQARQIARIFLPHAMQEMERVRASGTRFTHYTAAETGLKILGSGRMFLRNSTLMNDFSEIHYGYDCLASAYKSDIGDRLKAALTAVQKDLPEILASNFDGQILDVRNETYLMSISEHADDGHEDLFGRLSMWRAYAPKNGIAFVLNNRPFVGESDALGAFTSPVIYATPQDFLVTFEEVVHSIEQNIDLVKRLGGKVVHDLLINAFRFAVQSTKHPSFREEKEWRVIYSPLLLRQEGKMTEEREKRVSAEIMSLGGVPQRIYAIPFQDYPEEGFEGATIPDLLNRVLIGPSQDSYMIAQAYISELERLGVPGAATKVVITGVPLRQ